jgi:acyl-CoA synthetase (AMP-forming)/AMP-acid ligase II
MKRKFDSFINIFEKGMQDHPDKPAMIVGDRNRTYREIFANAKKVAAYLKGNGIKPDDPVAIISQNSLDYVETVLGCVMAGAIVVKLNWRLAAPELHQLLLFNHVKFIFFRSGDSKIRQEMQRLTVEQCPAADMDRIGEVLAKVEPLEVFAERKDDDILMRLHTSGTTGIPKTVEYTNRGFLNELETCVESLLFDEHTVFQMMSQLFHSASIGTYSCLACGGTIVFFSKFDPETYLASIEKNRVTRLSAIPTVLTALLNHPSFDKYDLSSIQMISYSTCPMPPELILRAMDKFHCDFQQSYGMTEMCSIVTMLSPEDHFKDNMRYLNSVGKPIARHEVRIMDENGQDCAAGEIGEIVVRGPGMMKDYYQMSEATRNSIVDGWYHTKDMGYLSEDNYLFISGRKNDMIISGGENIFPQEIENVLRSHPDIEESSVLGLKDDYWGEAVHACIVPKNGKILSEQQIRDYCRGKIAGYKIPKRVHILSEFPHTATGKVMKAELIKLIESD